VAVDQQSPIASVLNGAGWTSKVAIEDDEIHAETVETPNLRDVYDAIAHESDGCGVVIVDGQEQQFAIEYENGEVTDIEQRSGSYTINRMSRLERLFSSLASVSLFLIIGSILTGLVGLVLETPFSFVESVLGVVAGIIGFFMFSVLTGVVPGMTYGTQDGTPGDGIAGFDRLERAQQLALIAIDDAKSMRNESYQYGQKTVLTSAGVMVLFSYLFVLGYINFGAIGLIGVAAIVLLRTVFGVLVSNNLDWMATEIDDGRVQSIIDELNANSEYSIDPVVYGYGKSDNPVHANIAMALPEKNTLLLPKGDIENLRRDELKAVIAHEYKHLVSHYPAVLALVEVGLYLLPGIVLLVTGLTPTPLELGTLLVVYFLVFQALTGAVVKRWERQADAFAAEQSSPLSLAFALTRLVDGHVLDSGDESLLADGATEIYRSHPIPHKRVATLIDDHTGET